MRGLLAWLAFLLALVAVPASGQSIIERLVTPGPLSSAHARLESSCNSCHSNFRKEAQNAKCVACHKGIGADIAKATGFHGRFANARRGSCKSCHTEHRGRGFRIVTPLKANFNHGLTDYPLSGAHAKVACAKCHIAGRGKRDAPKTCVSCHRTDDPHKGKLGTRCQTCHQTSSWKTIGSFNHDKTGFRLSGAHRTAGCMACHKGQVWAGLSQSCVSCHQSDDVHKGSRGTNCGSCHSTADWKTIRFDHDTTGYPLVGAHDEASCESCHGANLANKHPSRSCFACHAEDDTHKGANGQECQSCHTPRGWARVTFDHDSTKFPLRGAHAKATCESCHVKPASQVKPPTDCYSCHQEDDSHKGGNGTDCARCHGVEAWDKVDFDHNRMTDFPLAGKHALAKCEACHVEPADKVQLIAQCASCHYDDDIHKGGLGPDCGRCHDANDWKTNIRFDHGLTDFPLLGEHQGLECKACHAPETYAVKGTACADCHVDDHHGGALGQPAACATCHVPSDWKSWFFDHDRQTSFALTGKHTGLVCSACHNRPGDPAKLGSACIDCHKRDDVHRGNFGEDCSRCHVTEGFRQIIVPQK